MANPFENALAQLEKARIVGKLDRSIVERVSAPEREIRVSIPVKMDDGRVQIFEGYRVQHSSARGPYKGGIRYHAETDINEVKALALWMMLKTAVSGIPMGGGKGGVTVDPKKLSKGELERLSRGWVKALWRNIGPQIDVPAPDVNTGGQIMSWMTDEYKKLSGEKTDATFTGKLIAEGGSEGREKATGLGGFMVFSALKRELGIKEGARIAIQGMGNVGGNAAVIFADSGYKVIAMSDSKGGIYNENGLNPKEVEAYKKANGSLKGYPNAKQISNASLLTLTCDVLIPAALENQITKTNAAKIKAKVILELANGPTTPEADDILFKRKIQVVPDILANSGGVVVSYFEWDQNLKNERWSEAEVNQKLKTILDKESKNVWKRALTLKTDLRRGAFVIALERIGKALK
jgi:glutamate dehydrogenase/leucine dehydrogenase